MYENYQNRLGARFPFEDKKIRVVKKCASYVILVHPNADYAGKNVLLTLFWQENAKKIDQR